MKFLVTTHLDSFILYNDVSEQEQVPNHNNILSLTNEGQTLISE